MTRNELLTLGQAISKAGPETMGQVARGIGKAHHQCPHVQSMEELVQSHKVQENASSLVVLILC